MKKITTLIAALAFLTLSSYAQNTTDQAYPHVSLKINHSGNKNFMAQIYNDKDSPNTSRMLECDGVLVADNWLLTRASCFPGGTNKIEETGSLVTKKDDYLYFVELGFQNKIQSISIQKTFKAAGGVMIQDFGQYPLSSKPGAENDLMLIDLSKWGIYLENPSYPQIMVLESESLQDFLAPPINSKPKRSITTNARMSSLAVNSKHDGYKFNISGLSGIEKGGAYFAANPLTGRAVLVLIQLKHNLMPGIYDTATAIPPAAALEMQEITKAQIKFVDHKFNRVTLQISPKGNIVLRAFHPIKNINHIGAKSINMLHPALI